MRTDNIDRITPCSWCSTGNIYCKTRCSNTDPVTKCLVLLHPSPVTAPKKSILLPSGLEPFHISKAVDWTEQQCGELVELYYEQANVFSGIVGIFGAKALHAFSPYKKHKHPDVAQQRFPDLSLNGKLNPSPNEALESKGSTRPWAIQSHYDHPGWYVVWRYTIDPTKTMRQNREVVIWRVDVVFLTKEDWKYEGSKAGDQGGGRTHTFGLRNPAQKLRDAAAYRAPNIVLKSSRPVLASDSDE